MSIYSLEEKTEALGRHLEYLKEEMDEFVAESDEEAEMLAALKDDYKLLDELHHQLVAQLGGVVIHNIH